jgi:hypothetical protein
VYTKLFRDPKVFPRLLAETAAQLKALGIAPEPRLRHITVTSFSAGFGGVRELLQVPESFDRIDALIMADSIHAGFVDNPADRKVNPANMDGFLRFAKEAAAGKKWLILSHSQIRPPNYASTTETADYLLAQLGGEREPTDEVWPGDQKLQVKTRFRKNHLL